MTDRGAVLTAAVAAEKRPARARLTFFLWALVGDKVTLCAALVLLVVGTAALAADMLPIHNPNEQVLRLRNQPPLAAPLQEGGFPHILGTDPVGRDVLSRLVYGSRISLAVGLSSVLISGTIGILLGLLAGYYRGMVDDVISRLVDLWMGFPSLLLALFVLYTFGPGLLKVIAVLAVTRWMVYARLTRSIMFALREEDFVLAARVLGCTDRRIMLRHMLPNLMSPIVVVATMEIATVVLVEASLDFLGLGIQPPESSWGLMLAQGRAYITSAWWLVTFPGLAIVVTTLSFNLLATWVRAVTDPVQRWRWAANRP